MESTGGGGNIYICLYVEGTIYVYVAGKGGGGGKRREEGGGKELRGEKRRGVERVEGEGREGEGKGEVRIGEGMIYLKGK